MTADHADVLAFWFEEIEPAQHFRKDAAFDRAIAARFRHVYELAANGSLNAWMESADGCLALVIVLDQFPRNMFRDTPRAFESDERAKEVADFAIDQGFDLAVAGDRRKFFYMPLQHSERLADQERCVALARERCAADDGTLDYAQQHLDVIERFA